MRPRHVVAVAPCLLLSALLVVGACADAGPKGDDDDDSAGVDGSVGGGPDARVLGNPDAAPGAPDAAPKPDAAPIPDASPGVPDAIVTPADAAPGGPVCDEAALLPDNDTCAAAIDLTSGAAMAGGVTTYGDTRGYVDDAEPPSACTGGFGQDGPDAVYAIDAVDGDTIAVTMTPEGYDGSVYILTDCMDPLSCDLGSDSGFVGGAETLSYPVTADATYYLFVDAFLSTEAGCYTLHVELL